MERGRSSTMVTKMIVENLYHAFLTLDELKVVELSVLIVYPEGWAYGA